MTQAIDTTFSIKENWDGGFTGILTFTNKADTFNGWEIRFDAPFNITEIYNASVVSHQGNRYVLQNDGNTNFVESGKTVSIFFVADDLGQEVIAPSNYTFNQQPMSLIDNSHQSNSGATETVYPNDTLGATEVLDVQDTGQFRYGEALQKSYLFYEAQRSGDLPSNNRIEWRGDSGMGDGSDVGRDLTGGYYDAGDHAKYGLPGAYSMTMLAWGVEEYSDAYAKSGQLDEALSAIKWGTDYFLKCNVTDEYGTKEFYGQVVSGEAQKYYWGTHENMTMQRPAYKVDREHPGSDLAGETAASLASASIIFRSSNSGYADTLVTNAKQLYDFAEKYQGKYSDVITDRNGSYQSSGYGDELAWGAAWLYKATGEQSYLDKAIEYYDQYVGIGKLRSGWTQDWDDKSYGTALILAQSTQSPGYQNDVERWLNAWSDTSGNSGIKYTSGGLAWAGQWGSLVYSADTAFLAGIYSDTVNDDNGKYANFAKSQVDYILGDNPRNSSYVVGFGNNSPQQPHHQTAHDGSWSNFKSSEPNKHIVYGAMVGGPKSTDDFDYVDDRTDYVGNELGISYNAALTGALAYTYDKFGGNPLTDAELDSLPGISLGNYS